MGISHLLSIFVRFGNFWLLLVWVVLVIVLSDFVKFGHFLISDPFWFIFSEFLSSLMGSSWYLSLLGRFYSFLSVLIK